MALDILVFSINVVSYPGIILHFCYITHSNFVHTLAFWLTGV